MLKTTDSVIKLVRAIYVSPIRKEKLHDRDGGCMCILIGCMCILIGFLLN